MRSVRGGRRAARALCASALTVGCARAVDAPRLPGTYVAARGPLHDTLVVRADGRWTRRAGVAGRRVLADSGRWWTGYDGEGWRTVGFDGFVLSPDLEGRGGRGTWYVSPERPLFGLLAARLPAGADSDEAYVRVGRAPSR